jgi:tight adherence protein C
MTGLMTAMVLSAGLGAGVLVLYRALRPTPRPLAATIADLRAPPPLDGADAPVSTPGDALAGWQARLARIGLQVLGSFGVIDSSVLRDQLRILDKPIERHAYEKLFGAVAGFLLPTLLVTAMAAGGVSVSPVVGLAFGAVLSTAGFFYPDLPLSEQVEKRQQAFRHALSSYLDLVTIILAGGGGIESALQGAADAGDGWAFTEIRAALRRAEFTGRTPWDTFDELGVTLGINELRELAASVALAGSQGAKVRQSLAAKADALRVQQAAAIEANAETRTEKMIVPVTVMIVGLTLFIGYGAVQAISTDGAATVDARTQTEVGR